LFKLRILRYNIGGIGLWERQKLAGVSLTPNQITQAWIGEK